MSCIFCRIISGDVQGSTVYENELFVVLMDIAPLAEGHMLVVPKVHAQQLEDLPDKFLEAALVLIKKIVMKVGTITKYNVLQNNGHIQSVPHVHFHIIPCNEREDGKEGLSISWTPVQKSKSVLSVLEQSYKELLKDLR
ncbi:hypothetical protein NECID01_1309 [Nematocida sp. AWRm77]|nr:hypothetical protein NECID01_1309 [Nematocida sp. AWRm77]